MSYVFTLTGKGNSLESVFNPSIDLSDGEWEVGLLNIITYNSIPNIDHDIKIDIGAKNVTIPAGIYDVSEIETAINSILPNPLEHVQIRANNNTQRTEVYSPKYRLVLDKTLAHMLGFTYTNMQQWVRCISDNPINMMKVSLIRVHCSIASGSYINGEPSHSIYDLSINVPPGFKLEASPAVPIYNTVTTREVNRLSIKLTDQNNTPVNFHDEEVTVRIHLRQRT